VLLLLAIAVLPLVAGHWWEHNRNKALVSLGLALPFALWWVTNHPGGGTSLLHSMHEYISFLALIGSLFIISGGIYIGGSLAGTPLANTAILGIGAVLANLIGTTGASMVLIRPLLTANKKRRDRAHIVVFFIFVVSNAGGLLTPLGDPPLFLGFLHGVPFAWTLSLWKEWLTVVAILLVVFNVLDQIMLNREERALPGSQLEDVMQHTPMHVRGGLNLLFLVGVLLVVLGSGYGWGHGGTAWPFGVQEALMLTLAALAFATTRREVRTSNAFSFGPIVEVAVLFLGIFATMTAPLLFLNVHGHGLGLSEPWEYFWATGIMSSVLDNAPTYLTFAATMAGGLGISVADLGYLGDVVAAGGIGVQYLAAISCGSVLMGANTYIGNGPNFMVKAIAESSGVKMPSFFGYMLWSGLVLLPVFGLLTLLFFS